MCAKEVGYLREPFRVFELSGAPRGEVPPHCHEFRKLVILLGGSIGYMLEDSRYSLSPGSIMLVEAGMIHRPLVEPGNAYERVIVYLSPRLFKETPGLGACFDRASRNGNWAVGPNTEVSRLIERCGRQLTDRACARSAMPEELQRCRLREFLILLGDCMEKAELPGGGGEPDSPVSAETVNYITAHLREELSVAKIAEAVHVSRSCLMHTFRRDTGCTIGEYITEKRLYYAFSCLERGMTLTEAAAESGFGAYSSFYRAWQKRFGTSPREDRNRRPPVVE